MILNMSPLIFRLSPLYLDSLQVKVQELLLHAPDESVDRLRELGLADDDIATAIATFELLPPSEVRGSGLPKLSFKTVVDERLTLRVSHSINVGSSLYRGLRLLCSEVNDGWPMQVRSESRRPKGGPNDHISKDGNGGTTQPLSYDDDSLYQATTETGLFSKSVDIDDDDLPIERNTARPISIPSPIAAAATGSRCLLKPMYYGASPSISGSAKSVNTFSSKEQQLSHAFNTSWNIQDENASLIFTPELSTSEGPDVLQPWPVGNTQQKAEDSFWSSVDIYMAKLEPEFAETLLGIGACHIPVNIDPAFAIPTRGPSWLLHEARPASHRCLKEMNEDSNSLGGGGGFHGYNEKEFTEQWLCGDSFIDHRILDFARSRGICCNTVVRWAGPADADALVAVNKV